MKPTLHQHTESSYKPIKDKSKKPIIISVFAYFIGLGFILYIFPLTFIDLFGLSKFIVGFMVIGFIIPIKKYSNWFHFVKYEVVIFNVLGVGPFLTGLFLWINYLFSYQPVVATYQIKKVNFHENNLEITLLPKPTEFESKIISIDESDYLNVFQAKKMEVYFEKGLFNYVVIKQRKFIS